MLLLHHLLLGRQEQQEQQLHNNLVMIIIGQFRIFDHTIFVATIEMLAILLEQA